MKIGESTFCRVFLDNPEMQDAKEYDGFIIRNKDEFIIKIKTLDMLEYNFEIGEAPIYLVINNEKCTICEIKKFTTNFQNEFLVYEFFATKILSGIFADNVKEEPIDSLSVEFDKLNLFFSSQGIDYKYEKNTNIITSENQEIIIPTEEFDLKILIWNPLKLSSDFLGIGTKTEIAFQYKSQKTIFEALNDLDYFISFLAFCSNNVYNFNKVIFAREKEHFILETTDSLIIPKTKLFALSQSNAKDFKNLIHNIYKDKNFLQFIFNQYLKTSVQRKDKSLNADTFSQWVSVMELVYNKYYSKLNIRNFDRTIVGLKNIISKSDELSTEQKSIAINRIISIIDNPLKEKIIKVLETANNLYYSIDPTYLTKDSKFINKIINTRNIGTHPNDSKNELFSLLEIDKLNCLFKHVIFIVVCKSLEIEDFGSFYYEKIEYFFDIINYRR